MESLALVVPRKKAEQIRKKLSEKNALRTDLRVVSDSKNVYFPVKKQLDMGYEFVTRSFKEQKQVPSDYRDLLSLPQELQSLLPSSLDIIGHVAIVKLPKELAQYAKMIGKAIAEVNKPVRTVCLDSGIRGEERTRSLKILYGKKDTLTTYREHGLIFRVDPRTMFFTPRLATERKIVADQVTAGETIFDMFAGVGPFSILIAKTRNPERIFASDINEDAFNLLEENIRLNKVNELVVPILSDVRDISNKIQTVDRVIMNLPQSGFEYIDTAIEKLSQPGIIHYYEIIEEDALEERIEDLKKKLLSMGRVVKKIDVRNVKSYSPTLGYFAIDIEIT